MGTVVEYLKTIKIHLVAIQIYSVYFKTTKKPFKRAGTVGKNTDAPGLSQRMVAGELEVS